MFSFLSAIFGLCVGSFLNALIFRLRQGRSVWRGRSQCPACRATLRWFELIPVASFVIQTGRCRRCRVKISWQYPLVELTTAILFILGLQQYPISNIQYLFINLLIYWFIVSVLIVLFVYDLRYGELPDKITLPAILILLIYQIWRYWILDIGYWILVMALLVGGGFFALQYFLSRGKWIGGGDIRLGVLMGVILGWPKILVALFLAYVGGAIISVFLLLLKKKTLKSAVPFGVFLIPATFAAMFWGQRIVEWYLKFVLGNL